MTAKDTARSIVSRAEPATGVAGAVIITSLAFTPYSLEVPHILLGAAIGFLLRGAAQK